VTKDEEKVVKQLILAANALIEETRSRQEGRRFAERADELEVQVNRARRAIRDGE
jgi:hypothetical protein